MTSPSPNRAEAAVPDPTLRGPSFWLDPPPEPGPPLEDERSVDVVVIGGGFAGLSAAIELRRRGIAVAVLERHFAGYGASGRNAGHLTPTIGKDLPSVLRGFGRERGGALVRLAESAVRHVEETLDEHRIDCRYRAVGNVVAGIHDGQRRRLERSARAGIELGASLRLLDRDELRERGLPNAFTCGFLEQRGGVLDPGGYVRGLAAAARRSGAEIWEASPALEIQRAGSGNGLEVRTPQGAIRAQRLVMATNAYTRELGVPARGPVSIRVTLLVTEPLPPEVRAAVGWPGEEGVYTAHEALESHRLTADGRILSGSRYVRYEPGGRPAERRDPDVFARTEAMMRARFPELEAVPVARFWSGPTAFNLNFLPWVGRSEDGTVSWAVGFAGHGVALASLAGVWLARLACDEDAGVPELADAPRPPMPPEPIRGVVARGLIAGLEWVDRRTDRRAR
jgi:gamma-glutamylputrescine oxidase